MDMANEVLVERDHDRPRRAPSVLRGSAWLVASNGVRLLLQLLSVPLLARLLEPADYGLIAMAMPYILLAMLLSDAGLAPALVRENRPSPTDEDSVFWFSLGLGCLLALGLCALSVPIALVMEEPRLSALLCVLSPVLVLGALCSVPFARLQREGMFWGFGVGDVASALAGLAAALGGALAGWGVWSLAAQQGAFWVVRLAVTYWVARFRPRARLDWSALRRMAAFGGGAAGTGVLGVLSRSIDALVAGWALGAVPVGHYNLAQQFTRLPETLLIGPVYSALFPAFARAAGDRAAAGRLYLAGVLLLVSVVLPAVAGLAIVSDLLVGLLLGPDWDAVAPIMAALSGMVLAACFSTLNQAALMGLGQSGAQLRLSALNAGLLLGCALLGSFAGILGIAAGLVAANLATAGLGLAQVLRRFGLGAGPLLSALWVPMLAGAAMAAALLWLRATEAWGLPPGGLLLVLVLAGAAIYAVAFLLLGGLGAARRALAVLR